MKHIVKKLAPILMTLAMIGLGGQTAQAVVTINGITWGDPFAGLLNLTKAQQLTVLSGLGGTVATWADIRTSADTNANSIVSTVELEIFLTALGFPTAIVTNLCPGFNCSARLSGPGEYVGRAFDFSYTFGAPSYILSDNPLPANVSVDDDPVASIGMLWIVTPTPEPSIIGLLGFSLFGLAMLRKKR